MSIYFFCPIFKSFAKTVIMAGGDDDDNINEALKIRLDNTPS